MERENYSGAVLHAVLDAATDAIIVADAEGRILRANSAACALFGHEQDALHGQSVNMLMPPDVAGNHDGYMHHYLDTGERKIIGKGREVEGQRKDGTVFPLHLSIGTAEAEGERIFVGILHDISQRKAAQDALARAQRLDAIGQMTGGISHDFNNILTVVIGNLELLQMRNPSQNQRQLIEDALASAELGAELTSRLMVFARKSNLKPMVVDLREVCEETLAILRRTLGRSYHIRNEFAPDARSVQLDPVQFQSALMNLVLNARDAMPDGGELLITIKNVTIDDAYLAQETDIAPGDYVRLSVSDNGIGMSAEAQKRAFEPFFTTKSEGTGTGLGLAMVYGFVRQSQGHITLYSEPGHGTSFGLYFPATGGRAAEIGNSAPTVRRPADGRPERRTVLVVEDNPKVRTLTLQRVRDLGYDVLEAESADAALAMLERGVRADILFSDLVMPGAMNGYDLAKEVAERFPVIRILLTSGYASDVITDAMAHDRVYDILHKPYRQSDLALRLQELSPELSED